MKRGIAMADVKMAQSQQEGFKEGRQSLGVKPKSLEVKPRDRSWKWRTLRYLLTSWRRRVVLMILVVATLFWLQNLLSWEYAAFWDDAVSSLGLGLAPVAAWGAFLIWVALKRPRWLVRRWNIWIGSLVVLGGILGIFGAWRAEQGILREVTLGGDLGYEIRGAARGLGALRLILLFLGGAFIISPRNTPRVIATSLRTSFNGVRWAAILSYTYGAVGWITSSKWVRRAYRTVPLHRLPVLVIRGIRRIVARSPSSEEVAHPQEEATKDARTPLDELLEGISSRPKSSGGPAAVAVEQPGQDRGPLVVTEEEEEITTDSPVHIMTFEHEEEEVADTPAPPMPTAEKGWRLPPVSILLEAPAENGGISEEEQEKTAEIIEGTLAEHGIEVTVSQIKPGPTVTMYGLTPGWNRRYKEMKEREESGQPRLNGEGRPIVSVVESKTRVKVGSIVARENDLALALAAQSIRIEAPVPGESVVGIEVPNPNPSLVTLRSVMESEVFADLRTKAQLPIALGKGTGGEVVVMDLARMPHLLIAGATGSGKSVCMNSIISCLLMQESPADLRLLLIDPKRVELNSYNGIPHLLKPTVVEADRAVDLLKGLINEMLRRYRSFEEIGARNIEGYNEKAAEEMPYIVLCIDELADIMMASQYDVEHSLCRIAQLGRATGIHLVVATQRPSVNVVTGLIKANIPSRISFAVASQVDSRTILDSVGAEKLLGRGDMLYLPLDGIKSKRVQGVFISDQEIESVVNLWTTTQGPTVSPISLEPEVKDGTHQDDSREIPRDELLDKAIELANSHSRLSTSLIQRRLRIGYPRAARLMEQLEEEGIVNSGEPGKSRDVLVR